MRQFFAITMFLGLALIALGGCYSVEQPVYPEPAQHPTLTCADVGRDGSYILLRCSP